MGGGDLAEGPRLRRPGRWLAGMVGYEGCQMTRLARHLLAIAVVWTLTWLVLGFFAGRATAHDGYSDWKQPNGLSCCNDHDCRPVTASVDQDGNWTVNVDGRRVAVPAGQVLKMPSPDGRSHWCGYGNMTYCFVPGEVRF